MTYKKERIIVENEHQYYLRSKLIELQENLLNESIQSKCYLIKSQELTIQQKLIEELIQESKQRIERL